MNFGYIKTNEKKGDKNMEHEDIVIAIKELDKSLNCISFDIPTTKLLEQTNNNLNQIAK